METIYRKVAVSERLPKSKEMLMTSHGWSLWNGHQFEDEDDKPISYINYWLEEIPDPTAQLQADKAELLEALEKVKRLEPIICMGGAVAEQWQNEAQALNEMMSEIESLIQKHKQ